MKISKKEIYTILLLGSICLFFFFFKLGSYRLIDVDEPRYAEAAREMIESWNWITPYFNYELRFDKPIFFYWLIALSYLLFGVTEFAARFPSALLATGLVFLTYYFGKTTISRSFGLMSSIVLASSLEFIGMARMSITDMTLAVFICASIYAGLLATFKEGASKRYWWYFAYLFSGIAVLTKGPVGLVLPGIVLGTYLILTGKLKESLNPKFIIPGLLIFIFSVTPWYYAIISEHGSNFINYFFLKHNFARFASSGFKQHAQPFHFYFIVVFAGFFPWMIYLISSLIKVFRNLYKQTISKKQEIAKFNFALFKDADNKFKVILASVIWFLLIFLFFSTAKAKLVTYILPIFPAIAMLVGNLWHEYVYDNKNNKSILYSTIVLVVICIIMGTGAILSARFVIPDSIQTNIIYLSLLVFFAFIFIPVIILFYMARNQKLRAFIAIITLMIAVTGIAVNNILPIVYHTGQRDLINYIAIYKSSNIPDKKLMTYNLVKPSVVFYSREQVANIKDNDLIHKHLSGDKPVFVIIRNRVLKELSSESKLHLIHKGVRYSLISNIEVKKP